MNPVPECPALPHDGAIPPVRRRHDLDVLRVGVFALLILYHLGMGYVADWPWHVKSAASVEWLQWPMMAVNRWRMPLLFLISGAAIGMLGSRAGTWAFCQERIVRLLVPLLFAMVAVIPVQAWCQAVANGAWSGGFPAFLVAYFSFSPWPPGAFDGAEVGVTWNHLWYLVYLLAYTLLLAAAMPLLQDRRVREFLSELAARAPWSWVLLIAFVPTLSALTLAGTWPPTNNFFADWYQHGVYFPVFVTGFLLARLDAFWDMIVATRWRLLGAAAGMGVAYFGLLASSGDLAQAPEPVVALLRVLRMGYMASVLVAILAWSRVLLDRPFSWLPEATEALFPWYILHQSIIVLALFLLADLHLPALAEAGLVLATTIAGCALGTMVIRRVRWLRPLFGLKAEAAGPGQARAVRVPA